MLAQVNPIPISENLTNPTSWTEMAKAVGFEGVFAIMLLSAFVALLIISIVVIFRVSGWLFGPTGWLKGLIESVGAEFKTFLTNQDNSTTTIAKTLETHLNSCNGYHALGGPSCVVDIREAIHSGAEALRKIGRNEPCDAEVDRVHQVLRSQTAQAPSTTPTNG
jgi:hypothetical protein